MKYALILFAGTSLSTYSQNLHHQMLSAQGKSIVLSNGKYVSQTIGQQSVIGNSVVDGKSFRQGYQQSIWGTYISANKATVVKTTTYPNPFIQTVHFKFSHPIEEVISVTVFDIRGRLIFQQVKRPTADLLTIHLENLPASNYLVRLAANNYLYHTQIIKKQ